MPTRVIRIFCLLLPAAAAAVGGRAEEAAPRRLETDLLVVGGSEGGCAAAIQAARMGVPSITLVNDIDWLGGQFSAEALGAIDENARVPGGSRPGARHQLPLPRGGLFQEIVQRIETVNFERHGRRRPGNTRIITTCRPADAAAVFEQMLQPHLRSGVLRVERHYYPAAAELGPDGQTLTRVRFRSTRGAPDLEVTARLTIDASDFGDVIQQAGAAFECGPDLRSKYQEPEAPTSRGAYPPQDMNPITYTMVLVEADQPAPIPRPPRYDPRRYQNLRWPMTHEFFYTSRRLVDHYNLADVRGPDAILICHPANDYPLHPLPQHVADALEADQPGAARKNIVEMTRRQRQIVFDDAKLHTLGLLYWLQNDLHDRLPDKTHSFRRFQLSDEFGTPDRLPPKPYVRETLRLKAMYMVRQQDTLGHDDDSGRLARVMFHDGLVAWQFEYDFHPTRRQFLADGDPAGPWQAVFRPLRNWGPPYSGLANFPLRSLIPERIDGLLAAGKNLGYSSIVSSAVRLHDHCTAVGQAAGAAAAVALARGVPPRAIPYDLNLLEQTRAGLCDTRQGAVPALLWPFADLAPDHPAFVAAHRLAARQALPLAPQDVNFHAQRPADEAWRRAVVARSLATLASPPATAPPAGDQTRGEFIRRWWRQIQHLPLAAAVRRTPDDADADGLPDAVDPAPLDGDNNNRMDHLEP